MYKVKLNDKYIYHPWDKDLQISDPKLDTELNKNGSFSFVIYPDNTMYYNLEKLKSKLHIIWFDDNGNEKEIFRCRILNEETDFDGEKTVTCEGDLAFLLDTIQRPYSSTVSPADRFKQLINAHNSQVEPDKQFQIGNITMTGDSVKVTENSYPDTRADIENKLLNVYGGYIRTREQNGKYYIDYLKDYEDREGQSVRYGENILDITKYIKAEDIKTCIIPLGATNSATGKVITIASVNNGVDYLYDQSAVDTFGKIYGTVSFSDVESPNTLKQKGQEQVEALKNLIVSIELTAVDLKDLGYDVKEISVGDFIPVVSMPHGINSYMQVSKKSQNLKKPEDSSIVLGSTIKTLVESQNVYNSGIQNVIPAVNNAVNTANNAANKAEQVKVEMDAVTNKIYPVGSIHISVNNANPASFFGGSWTAFATGRTIVGVDTSQGEFNSVEKPGGNKDAAVIAHIHSVNAQNTINAGVHDHDAYVRSGVFASGNSTASSLGFSDKNNGKSTSAIIGDGNHYHNVPAHNTNSTGQNGAGKNLPPYITVYMWKRIG